MRKAWLPGVLLAASLGAQAEHITDKLVVGLYQDAKLAGEPVQLISSGTPLEVLERGNGVMQVRLADDTRGWVQSSYVTAEKPASMMLLEAQAEIRRMKQHGLNEGEAPASAALPSVREAQLQQALEQAEARIERLQQDQAEVLAGRMAQQKLEALRERVAKAQELLGSGRAGLAADAAEQGVVARYLPWIIAAVACILGFGAGVGFVDYRIRRRYGGFRI